MANHKRFLVEKSYRGEEEKREKEKRKIHKSFQNFDEIWTILSWTIYHVDFVRGLLFFIFGQHVRGLCNTRVTT